jgi:hypothetical protein
MPGITDLQTKKSEQSLVDFLNSDPNRIAFGMESQIEKLFQDYMMAKNSGDIPRAKMLNDKINEMQAEIIRLKNMGGAGMEGTGRTISNMDRQIIYELGRRGRTMSDLDNRPGMALGGPSAVAAAARNLPKRVKDLANTVMGRKIPGRMTDKGNLTAAASFGAVPRPRILGAMTGPLAVGLGGAGAINVANYPEEFGALVAKGQITYEQAFEAATQKLGELGQASAEAIAITKEKIRRGYEQEIDRQRQKEIEQIAAEDKPIVPVFGEGGEASFPDLTGDNKVTQADILKGRGVFAEGDEVSMEMMEMEMEPEGDDIQESLMAIQGANQEAAPLDQFVQAVIQMIQAGASEQEVIEMLRQAGLDEEDINAVFQAVMQSLQGPGIDQELAALG